MTVSHHAARAQTVRRSLRIITTAWVFGAAWQWGVAGAAQTQFAKSLHMPDKAFGLMAMVPWLAGLAQLPASLLLARWGHRRSVFLVSTTVSRLLWTVMAVIPWVLPSLPGWWWPLLIWGVLIASVNAHVGTPAWMNWMADVIPWKVRGRYFAVRNRIGLLIGVATTLAVGKVLDLGDHPELMLKTTSIVIAVAGLVGAIDPLCFLAIKDSSPPPCRPRMSLAGFLLEPLSDRSFRWYLAYNFTIIFSIVASGQYVWLYVLDFVHMSNTTANFLLQAFPLVVMAATYGLWGRLMDRVGRRPVLIVCTALSILWPIGWTLVQPGLIWIGFAITIPNLLAWAGVEAANFNLLLNLSGSREDRHGAACVSLNALAQCAGGVTSGLLGSAIAARLTGWQWPIAALGLTFTYHSLIFAFTAAARVVAVWMAVKIHEPQSHGTRQVIRHMTGTFYSGVKQVMALPGWLGLWD